LDGLVILQSIVGAFTSGVHSPVAAAR
jgi:hypothetical protein